LLIHQSNSIVAQQAAGKCPLFDYNLLDFRQKEDEHWFSGRIELLSDILKPEKGQRLKQLYNTPRNLLHFFQL